MSHADLPQDGVVQFVSLREHVVLRDALLDSLGLSASISIVHVPHERDAQLHVDGIFRTLPRHFDKLRRRRYDPIGFALDSNPVLRRPLLDDPADEIVVVRHACKQGSDRCVADARVRLKYRDPVLGNQRGFVDALEKGQHERTIRRGCEIAGRARVHGFKNLRAGNHFGVLLGRLYFIELRLSKAIAVNGDLVYLIFGILWRHDAHKHGMLETRNVDSKLLGLAFDKFKVGGIQSV